MNPNDFSPLQDELLLLFNGATLTTTASGPVLDLGNGFAPGGGGSPMQMAVNVTAIKTSAGDETYSLKVQDSPDNAAWTDRTPGVLATKIDMFALQGFIVNRYVRLVRTIGGTAPTITIGNVYLNPNTVA